MSDTDAPAYDFGLCLAIRPTLHGYASKLTRDTDAAQDIVQDALMCAFRAWRSFVPRPGVPLKSAVSGWMHRIVHNTFIKHWRKRKVRAHLNLHANEDTQNAILWREEQHNAAISRAGVLSGVVIPWTSEPSEDGRRTIDGLGDELEAALADLNPRHRQIVELVGLHDGCYHEVARALDIPIGTVMSSLNRARNRLIARLGPWAAREYGIEDQRESREEASAP